MSDGLNERQPAPKTLSIFHTIQGWLPNFSTVYAYEHSPRGVYYGSNSGGKRERKREDKDREGKKRKRLRVKAHLNNLKVGDIEDTDVGEIDTDVLSMVPAHPPYTSPGESAGHSVRSPKNTHKTYLETLLLYSLVESTQSLLATRERLRE